MVEATQGDGIIRNVPYGKWRTNKEAEHGYSRELVHYQLEEKFYDNLSGIPELA